MKRRERPEPPPTSRNGEDGDGATPFERFERLTEQLVSVPKNEIDKARAKDDRARAKKARARRRSR